MGQRFVKSWCRNVHARQAKSKLERVLERRTNPRTHPSKNPSRDGPSIDPIIPRTSSAHATVHDDGVCSLGTPGVPRASERGPRGSFSLSREGIDRAAAGGRARRSSVFGVRHSICGRRPMDDTRPIHCATGIEPLTWTSRTHHPTTVAGNRGLKARRTQPTRKAFLKHLDPMGLGLSPRQVWLATLINLLLSLGLGGVVLVSNFRTWRAVSSASLVDLHVSLLYITTALAVASIVSGVVGFAGEWIGRAMGWGDCTRTDTPNHFIRRSMSNRPEGAAANRDGEPRRAGPHHTVAIPGQATHHYNSFVLWSPHTSPPGVRHPRAH